MNATPSMQGLLTLGFAIAVIPSLSLEVPSNKCVKVYWFYTTTSPRISIHPCIVAVDISGTPLIGTETTVPTGCNNDGDLWCAKGFSSSQVDLVTHKPSNEKSPGTYAAAKLDS